MGRTGGRDQGPTASGFRLGFSSDISPLPSSLESLHSPTLSSSSSLRALFSPSLQSARLHSQASRPGGW